MTIEKKYERSVIKLGNSMAMTFPREWFKTTNLKEHSKIFIYPINDNTLILNTIEKKKKKLILKIDGCKWYVELIKQLIISAFRLNVDKLYLKYNDRNYKRLYIILTELQRQLIGLDFQNLNTSQKFCIKFLVDSSKITLREVLLDLMNLCEIFIKKIFEDKNENNYDILMEEYLRRYHLGTRIIVYSISQNHYINNNLNSSTIQFLTDQVALLQLKEFIYNTLKLKELPKNLIIKYSEFLKKFPKFLTDLIKNYNEIDLQTIQHIGENLVNLRFEFDELLVEMNIEKLQLKSIIECYFKIIEDFISIYLNKALDE
ncbi:MAG: hypothetical protein ACFFAN_02980 [Promethearchaeota archaeon]